LDLSGIKLESAQKEKNSFLEELKKQSFVLSESSTQKIEAKESLDVSKNNQQNRSSNQQNRGSDDKNNPSGEKSKSLASLTIMLQAD
jgi:hypothetical protein